MGPLGSQGLIWSEILCCPICNQIFSNVRVPVNLLCGHAACLSCLHTKPKACPADSVPISENVIYYPINTAFLSIIGIPLDSFVDQSLSKKYVNTPDYQFVVEAEKYLYALSAYLRVADSEKGGAVYSDLVSRTIQRKIVSILCSALTENEGRIQAMRAIRSLSERIVTELICVVQNTIHLSAYLWSAVRARGCQFLGPAMQEDVLRLILLTLANGELIARKTLVMYIVQTLSEDYPHVSKTCVGHVVQLLYRASCFNVIKREGESSLMQLKEEFREYESLRREHDSQIVQIALEAGLRISPDQWSALLYGDPHHRSHMQSIVDRLHSPQLLSHALKELRNSVERNANSNVLQKALTDLESIAGMDPETDSIWKTVCQALGLIEYVIYEYVSFNKKNSNSSHFDKHNKHRNGALPKNNFFKSNVDKNQGYGRYKTKMCRDVMNGRNCPRGSSCTYAHQQEELRTENDSKNTSYFNIENDKPNENSNQFSDVQQQSNNMLHPSEVISYPVVPIQHQQIIRENGSVMMDNNQYLMPMMVPNQINEMQTEQYQKVGPPVGMTAPILVMHPEPMPNAPHSVIMQNPVQVIRHPPPQMAPTAPQVNGFQYRMPQPGPIMGPPQAVVYPTWNQNYSTEFNNFTPTMTQNQQHYSNANNSSSSRERKDSELTGSSFCSDRQKLTSDETNLIARRNEVLSRLKTFDTSKDESEEDAESHVSYTVANWVLFDDVEPPINAIDFPPLPIQPLPKVPISVSPTIITEAISNTSNVPWTYSLSTDQKTTKNNIFPYVRTVCPTTLLHIDFTKPATVQSDCTIMNVKDAIDQPLVTAAIQSNNLAPQASYDMVDPCQLTEHLPKVMQPIPLAPIDPQDFVSSSIDKILTVREKINDEHGRSNSSAVEKEQLKVELNIANRQLSTLDQQTKQTCLLKELKAIDEKLGTSFSESN